MKRTLYEDVHEDFRASFRTFLQREVLGARRAATESGSATGSCRARSSRSPGAAASSECPCLSATAAPARRTSALPNLIIGEETQSAGVGGFGLGITLHNDICLPYFLRYCDESQRERWLGGIVPGELITALAMTEPGIGSDLAGMSTRARREGDHYVVDGTKTFITNGINADLVITAVKTRTRPSAIAASAWS